MGMSGFCDLRERNKCVQREHWSVVGPTPLTNNYKCNRVTVKPAQSLQEGKSGQGEGALGQVCEPLRAWSPWQDSWTLVPKHWYPKGLNSVG